MKTADWIAVSGVVANFLVAVVAIFGEWIKSLFPFLRPRLRIDLIGLTGNLVRPNNGLNARYYHVRVKNMSPFVAHQVRILITLVEKPDAAGQPVVVFGETVPLWWVRQEVLPLAQDIGATEDADAALFLVRADGVFEFTPIVVPNHFPQPQKGRSDYWVTLKARSLEAESKPVRVKIAWDGQWIAGEREIAAHLVVSQEDRQLG